MIRTPDFLIIGAQKCGTSWLHHQLRQSRDIFMPEDKDFEHFSYVGNLNPAAFERYCRRFADAGGARVVGDANAAYFWTRTGSPWSRQPDSFNPDIPRSVHAACGPDLKLVLILRDPVERAISAYLHHIRHGAITPATSILDRDLPLGIVDMSLFRIHLDNWLAVYPRAALHLIPRLPSDDDDAVRLVEGACRFLDAAPPERARYHLAPVFPGLPRIVDAQGVWLSERSGVPDLGAGQPQRVVGDERFWRVVSAAELEALNGLLDAQRISA